MYYKDIFLKEILEECPFLLWSTEQNKKMEEVSMNSTALGAKKENINFISEAHEKFYYEKIQKVRKQMYITRHFAIALE